MIRNAKQAGETSLAVGTKRSAWIGLDVGGTSVKAGIVLADGDILLHRNVRHRVSDALDTVYAVITGLLQDAEQLDLAVGGIGIAAPGRVDTHAGVVINASNLRWRHVAIRDEVERRFRLPAAVMNDANAAAVGEQAYGGLDSDHFVCITVGTGIGAGLILDGRLVEGARFLAGEIGHVPVWPDGPPCVCGNAGCLETIASGNGMVRRYREKTAPGTCAAPAVSGGAADDPPPLAEIVRRAGLGDEAAAGVLEEAAEALGAVVAFIVQLLDVEAVVLAGGVVKMDWPFTDRVRAAANRLVVRSSGVTVRKSGLVDVNAILGAVARLQQGTG